MVHGSLHAWRCCRCCATVSFVVGHAVLLRSLTAVGLVHRGQQCWCCLRGCARDSRDGSLSASQRALIFVNHVARVGPVAADGLSAFTNGPDRMCWAARVTTATSVALGVADAVNDLPRLAHCSRKKGGRLAPPPPITTYVVRNERRDQPQISAVMLAYQPKAYLASSLRKPAVASFGLTPPEPGISVMPLSVTRYTPATEIP